LCVLSFDRLGDTDELVFLCVKFVDDDNAFKQEPLGVVFVETVFFPVIVVVAHEAVLDPNASAALRARLVTELNDLSSAEHAATWGLQALAAKNTLLPADAERVESALQVQLSKLASETAAGPSAKRAKRRSRSVVDKTVLSLPTPRRMRDREHVKSVAKQPCLVCGRRPADAHHLRFAQSAALGRKVSDEFTVPLCRGHHREVHRCGDEAAWWVKTGIDPSAAARVLWLKSHPLPSAIGQPISKLRNMEVIARADDG